MTEKKPSELVEDEALAIHSDEGTIGFHRYYGELQVSAINAGADPRTRGGIGIPMSAGRCR